MDRETFMEIAWRDFIAWAVQSPDVIAQYERETGDIMPVKPTNGIEAMIDQATGYKPDFEPFVFWATEQLWGVDDAPERLRLAMSKNPQTLPQTPRKEN